MNETPVALAFAKEFYQTLREQLIPSCTKLNQKREKGKLCCLHDKATVKSKYETRNDKKQEATLMSIHGGVGKETGVYSHNGVFTGVKMSYSTRTDTA